jgi:hypothetical protein
MKLIVLTYSEIDYMLYIFILIQPNTKVANKIKKFVICQER